MSEAMATPATLRIRAVNGDLALRRWEGVPDDAPRARVIHADDAILEVDLPYDLGSLDGDVSVALAGRCGLTIDEINGDCVAWRLLGEITIRHCHGDLRVEDLRGGLRGDAVEGDVTVVGLVGDLSIGAIVGGDLAVDHVSGAVTVASVRGDITIRSAASLTITDEIRGDLRAQNVTLLEIPGVISGDVTLAHAQRANLGEVRGDLTVIDLGAELVVQRVAGDARLRDVRAAATLADVAGDLTAQEIAGLRGVCRGDAFVETRLTAGRDYAVTAAAIVFRVRSPISAQFVAESAEGEISTHLPLTLDRHRQHLVGVIGKGEATVTLVARGGDILLDAAGHAAEPADDQRGFAGAGGRRSFHVLLDNGPNGNTIDVNLPIEEMMGAWATSWWPLAKGAFSMSSNNTQPGFDSEQRFQDLSDRATRAARKAGEKFKEYADRAAARARDTDWEAVSRDVRTAFERVATELEGSFREIIAEFQQPSPASQAKTTSSGPTAQRIPVDKDPVTGTATPASATPTTSNAERDARRRAILEQVRNGELTLDDAELQLRDL